MLKIRIIRSDLRHVIEAEKAVGKKTVRLVYISRMPLTLNLNLIFINKKKKVITFLLV